MASRQGMAKEPIRIPVRARTRFVDLPMLVQVSGSPPGKGGGHGGIRSRRRRTGDGQAVASRERARRHDDGRRPRNAAMAAMIVRARGAATRRAIRDEGHTTADNAMMAKGRNSRPCSASPQSDAGERPNE